MRGFLGLFCFVKAPLSRNFLDLGYNKNTTFHVLEEQMFKWMKRLIWHGDRFNLCY